MLERIVGTGWGSVEISGTSTGYDLGASVDGSVAVRAKRDLGPGHLTVALVCVRRDARTIPPVFNKRITRESVSTEVWRTLVDVDTDVVIEAGELVEYPFELQLPDSDTTPTGDDIPEWARGTIAVLNTVTFTRSTLQWHLRAKFRHPDGFDLRHHRSIVVNA